MAEHRCTLRAHPRLPRPDGGWPTPTVDDVVHYRGQCTAPLMSATVLQVDMDDQSDPNVWMIDEQDQLVLLPDPNPNVTLRTADGGMVVTRQVRYADSAGWEKV